MNHIMNTSNLKVKVDFFGNEKLMNIFDYDTAKKNNSNKEDLDIISKCLETHNC